jgi:hypothetical protein
VEKKGGGSQYYLSYSERSAERGAPSGEACLKRKTHAGFRHTGMSPIPNKNILTIPLSAKLRHGTCGIVSPTTHAAKLSLPLERKKKESLSSLTCGFFGQTSHLCVLILFLSPIGSWYRRLFDSRIPSFRLGNHSLCCCPLLAYIEEQGHLSNCQCGGIERICKFQPFPTQPSSFSPSQTPNNKLQAISPTDNPTPTIRRSGPDSHPRSSMQMKNAVG